MDILPCRTVRIASALLLACAFGAACSAGKDREPLPEATELLVRPQTATLRAGETVQLSVQVNDARGHAIGGAPVVFSADSTSLVRVSSTGLLSAAGAAGQDSVRVSSGALSRQIAVSVRAGPPSEIDLRIDEPRGGRAGTVLNGPVVVIIHDAYGNAVSRQAVQFRTESGGKAEPAVVTTDAAGIARSMWTLGPLAGSQSIRVQADSAVMIAEATAYAGEMSRVQDVNPISRRTPAGDTVTVRLRATDSLGNGVSGVVFAYSVTVGDGSVMPARVESDSTGIAQTRWHTATTAGVNSLRVRAIDVRDTSFLLSIRTVGIAPARLELVSGDDQRVGANATVPRPPVVRVTDRHGNPVAAVRLQFTASAGSVVEPSELVTDDRGVATLRRWRLGAAGPHVLTVVADGVSDTLRIKATAR